MTARVGERRPSGAGRVLRARFSRHSLARAIATPHVWLIGAMLLLAAILHYFEPIMVRLTHDLPWGLTEYSMDRALFLLPITYAGFMFGATAGVAVLAASGAIMLPHCIDDGDRGAALTQTGAVLLVGLLMVGWFQAQLMEKERSRRTMGVLQATQSELRTHIEALRSEHAALETLNAVYTVCGESLDLEEILNTSTQKLLALAGSDIALIFLLDETGHEVELVAHRGVSGTFVQEVSRLRLGEAMGRLVSSLDQPVVESRVKEDSRLPQAAVAREGIESGVLVPVRARGRVFGTLCVATRTPHRFGENEVQSLAACGNALGIALENARLYQRVRASEVRYRNLFENASDAIFAHDLGGVIYAANEACGRVTGYSKTELIGMESPYLFPLEHREKVAALERELAAGAADSEDRLEVQMIRKDGSEVTIELGSTFVAGDDRPPGIQHVVRDVTEQRRAQESLAYYIRQITRAQEDERLRISRDLHDETAQSLLLVSQRLDGLMSDPHWKLGKGARHHLEEVRELTLQTLSDLRRLSEALRPRILDDLGLVPAVGWVADQMAEQDGIQAELEVRGVARGLPHDKEVLLFRIAQEALTNVRRHSRATRVDVVVEFAPDRVKLMVVDNGQGFEVPDRPSDLAVTGKLGILGMMERARLLGGTLTVRSEPAGGTNVSVEVPV